jgi:D-3-phosphoglycerate dehydrogenase
MYSNLFKVNIKTDNGEFNIEGCVYDKHIIKFTKIMDHQIDVTPEGAMLLIQNKDIPGVVGNIGTLLGSLKINIAEFILSRQKIDNKAYSIIKIDEIISSETLEKISDLDEIINVKQILINE